MIVVQYDIYRTNRQYLEKKKIKRNFVSFKNNNHNSKFSQYILENGHSFGKMKTS